MNIPISKNCSTTTQEGQGIIAYAHIARAVQQSPIVTITTIVLQGGQPNDSRGLEGSVSEPQIPCQVDWGFSF
jgi:hypothetical protein